MEQPIDRGEVDRSSLEATDRLRARLTGRPAVTPARSRPVLPWVLAAALLTFALGLIANPWFEHNIRARLPFAVAAVAATDEGQIAALNAKLAALEARAPPAAAATMPAERLARTEARVDSTGDQLARDAARIDQLTRDIAALRGSVEANGTRIAAINEATAEAADRAQGVLVVQLVRRAIDSGRPIGPLDAALRQSFEARYPAAVQAVTALGAAPVTPQALRRDLDALRFPVAAGKAGTARGGKTWFDSLSDAVSGIFAAEPASTGGAPVVAPADSASTALARGDLAAAAAQVRRMPASPQATAWATAADRLRAGTEALAMLETATALMPPSSPRLASAGVPAAAEAMVTRP